MLVLVLIFHAAVSGEAEEGMVLLAEVRRAIDDLIKNRMLLRARGPAAALASTARARSNARDYCDCDTFGTFSID